MKKFLFTIPLILGLIFTISSCRKQEFTDSSSAKLSYSTDTVTFDTIFTTVGTVTKLFKVYNKNDKYVRISHAYIKDGDASNFRINIDGVTGEDFKNIDIPPNDSIFVFVEAKLDPVNDNNPLVVDDAVVFNSNGNTDEVTLEAFGQDVHLYNSVVISSETWDNDKPYLIYNNLYVDSNAVLTINEGVHVYLHSKASLVVYGKLIVNGTYDNPVVFNGDRFDRGYDRSAGGWGTIFIHPRSRDNEINYAIIKNSIAGLQVGQPSSSIRTPSVVLNNVFISNSSFSSIIGCAAEIEANNCIFADAQYYGLAFLLGGKYNINNSTISIVGSFSVDAGLFERYIRNSDGACVALSNRFFPYYTYDKNYIFNIKTLYHDLTEANFTNTIIYGSHKLEFIADSNSEASFNYLFDHCLLRETIDSIDTANVSHFRSMIYNEDPRFVNDSIMQGKYDFKLDTLSPAKDAGTMDIINKNPTLKYDYEGKSRTADGKPDLGAFEREE